MRPVALVAVFVALVAVAGTSADAAQPRPPLLDVSVTSAGVRLIARDVRIGDVLTALGRKAGVNIVLRGDFTVLVSETLTDVAVDDVIRRLSRWYSVVLLYDAISPETRDMILTEARITSSTGAEGNTASGGVPLPFPATRMASQQHHDLRPIGLTRALKYGALEARLQVVEQLVAALGSREVLNILRDAATLDRDSDIRRAAIQTLGFMDSREAGETIRAALRDPHPLVRQAARAVTRMQAAEGSR